MFLLELLSLCICQSVTKIISSLESVGDIALLLGGSCGEDYEPKATDERNEADEKPPSTLADIMHATDADCYAGDYIDESEDAVQNQSNLAQAQQDCIYYNHI